MKFIHCADIHLDSALSTNFTRQTAENRRAELLKTFVDMVEYAAEHEVRAIIIAGDLFDTTHITKNTKDVVSGLIKKYEDIDFLYLSGNHDEGSCIEELGTYDNLKVFGRDGALFYYDNAVITAMDTWPMDTLKSNNVNIVVGHCDMPDMSRYAGKNINYLALGHIHKHIAGRIDARGEYCYCGCLEARGFDECGEQGFVLLDVSDTDVRSEFVEFGKRHAICVDVPVSFEHNDKGLDTVAVCDAIEKALVNASPNDMVKVRLTGELMPGETVNINYIREYFANRYFAFRAEDKTALIIDVDALGREMSLKGEFIRNVLASDETEDVKRDIIRCGLSALMGEETLQ